MLRIDEIVRLAFPINILLIGYVIVMWSVTQAESSRADLGTYMNIKELPSAQDEKITVDTVNYASINYTYQSDDTIEMEYKEEKARYGEGKVMSVHGYLIHVTDMLDPFDHTGCSPKIVPPLRHQMGAEHSSLWIALIQRGGCTFDDKIKNAYLNRAAGVIVYNDDTSMTLEKMKVNDKERNITAVFTYKWIGEEMAKIVASETRVFVSITEGQRVLKPVTNINKTSVLFVSVSFIVLMIISLVWLIFYYVQRFRYLQSKDQHSRQLCTVAKRIIGKIPTKSGKDEDKNSDNDCCAICIEPYKPTDCIRILPCRHEFHKNCIDPWLLEHRTCPMCKLDVLKHYGFVFIGSEESFMQLDLDLEIGTGHNPAGQRQSRQNRNNNTNESPNDISHPIQITITPPDIVVQSFDGENGNIQRIFRRSSFETMTITRRASVPERSQSSMSHCPVDESFSNRLFLFATSATSKPSKNAIKSNESCFLSPDHFRRDKLRESVSLPGTLKKAKRFPSGGDNNSYINAAASDLKHLAIRLEKGNPIAGTMCLRKDIDNELLLANEKTELNADLENASPIPASILQDDLEGEQQYSIEKEH